MIKPGEEWGIPTTAAADVTLRGTDAELAALVRADGLSPLVRWSPVESEFARSVGLHPDHADTQPDTGGFELPVDAFTVEFGVDSSPRPAVNVAVMGTPPAKLRRQHRARSVTVVIDGRAVYDGLATTVVIANGQYLDGCDLVPRGHPGDGRLEIQVYALGAGERGPMRRRLPSGAHLPHPRIVTGSGRIVEVGTGDRAWAVALDGHPAPTTDRLLARIRPAAIRLLI
ncbi:MAG: hypothetical protein ABJC79_03365 [Acidimicrobiia bacterium]